MARHKSRAFVLASSDYRETSKLLHLFCENEGRITVIGRGLRSPKSQKAQLADAFNLLQVNYTLKDGATLGTLTAIEPEQLFSGLRQDLDAYALANYWFEILKVAGQSRLASHSAFELTQSFLSQLQGEVHCRSSVRCLLNLAHELGFAMQIHRCSVCGNAENINRFSINSGTAFCSSCPIHAGRSVTAPYALGTQPQLAAFLPLYNEYLSTHLEHRFTTFSFLRQVMKDL